MGSLYLTVDTFKDDDFGLTALWMAHDLKAVRYDLRVAANKTTINLGNIAPKEDTIAVGTRIVDWRADMAVPAIKKTLWST